MPLFSLHADYDRNGVLNATASEYSLRTQLPGALLTPNLDSDGVALPSSVSCGSPPVLDVTVTTKSANDNDLIPLLIRANAGTVISNYDVKLKIADPDAQKINLYDATKHRIRGNSSGGITAYILTFSSNDLNLFVESVTVNGSPLLTPPPSSSLSPVPVNDTGYIVVSLEVTDIAAGSIVETDAGLFTPSPLFLLGDHVPAERLYMCEINGTTASLSDNCPSFTDVVSVTRGLRGVRFVPVPLSVSNGDSWLQDQFQVGYCQGSNSNMKVVFHLPRLRADARLAPAGNGLSCIATDHFPSLNLGVFNDFWKRSVTVRDVVTGSQSIPFANTVELQMLFNKVWQMYAHLWRIINELCQTQFGRETEITSCATRFNIPEAYFDDDLIAIITHLTDFKNRVVRLLTDARAASRDPVIRQRLDNTITDIQASVPALLGEINFRSDGGLAARTQNLSLVLEPDDIPDLVVKLEQMHSSHNYGGNIEVSPPMTSAPLGKIVIGNANDSSGNSAMDPELISFLFRQNLQPLVPIDTTWLQVGHADEVVNFASVNVSNSFAIVLASPAKAYQLLEEIFLLNTEDLPVDDPDKELYGRPLSIGDARMARGPHPVTRLLRGKHWLQSYRPNDKRVMPPKIYTDMNMYYGDVSLTPRRFYPIPWADDHYYDARISVREILYFSSYSNRTVIEKIQAIKETMEQEFPDRLFIELPVIFDNYNPAFEQTIAFTPDLVNYQTLNNRILMPRPNGPRMSVDDTVTILNRVMGSSYSSHINRRNIERKRLNKTFHWTVNTVNELSHVITGPYNRPVTVDLDVLADQFKDGFFPQTTDLTQIKQRIRRANPGVFMPNGNLRTGWHKIEIPENKVDVFETYTQIMLESIGLTVDWVDSWYYHIRSGGIHCGTNVIRTPDLSPRNAWWNLHIPNTHGPGDFNLPDNDTMLA